MHIFLLKDIFKYKYLELIKQFEHLYWDSIQPCDVKVG